MDKTDISQERNCIYLQRAKIVVDKLNKRNISAQYVSNRNEALSVVLEMIPENVTVARGGSITLEQVGVIAELKKRNQNKLIDPEERNEDGSPVMGLEEKRRMMRESFFADVFLTSTNAVTLDGKLVNTDALGNRVAAMIFGPKKVIVVAGVNKIVKDVNEAIARIHNICAPMIGRYHYLRHNRPEFGNLSCIKTGICVDCNHDWRHCRHTVITEGARLSEKGRINVVLVGEELGM